MKRKMFHFVLCLIVLLAVPVVLSCSCVFADVVSSDKAAMSPAHCEHSDGPQEKQTKTSQHECCGSCGFHAKLVDGDRFVSKAELNPLLSVLKSNPLHGKGTFAFMGSKVHGPPNLQRPEWPPSGLPILIFSQPIFISLKTLLF